MTKIFTFLIVTVLALLPQYIIRSNFDILYFFYNHFTTYFGDLWYCWNNYLHSGFPYPREYPSGIQILFQILYLIPGVRDNYNLYIAIISSILTIVAIFCTVLMVKIANNAGVNKARIYIIYLLAPSYLFYGLLNLDFLALLPMLLSLYFFNQKKYLSSSIALAVGTFIKLFPIFILPVLFFSCVKNKRVNFIVAFIIATLVLNIPFMIADFGAWSYPYIWQAQENYARSMGDGSWMWVVYYLLNTFNHGYLTGKISLVIFAGSYFYFMRKNWNLSIYQKIAMVMVLFLLTDRVYSPQYNLYLLPFLALCNFRLKANKFFIYFYLLEFANVALVFFCFYLKNSNQPLLQTLVLCKYFALIMIFRIIKKHNYLEPHLNQQFFSSPKSDD